MDEGDTPDSARLDGNLRFLRLLVTVLTAVMILGLIILIVLFVTRFPGGTAAPALPAALPQSIALPEGAQASAVTLGDGWVAVVDRGARILVYDAESGALLHSVEVAR